MPEVYKHCSMHKETDPRWGLDLSGGEITAVAWGRTGAVTDRQLTPHNRSKWGLEDCSTVSNATD